MKKLFALLLSLVMLLSLVACGGTSTARTEEPSDDPKTEEPAPSTDSSGNIKVGVYSSMTGSNAGSGLCTIEGAQMAAEEINAAGGIDGRMLELIIYDDAGTSEGATKAATRLIEEDGVQAIVATFQSAPIAACAPLTESAKVLHVGSGTGATWTNCGLDYTYRANVNAGLFISSMIDALLDMDMKSIALISVESDYGQSGRADVIAQAEAAGIEVKVDLTYQSADTDFTGIINKALAADADTFVLYGLGNEVAMIIKQLRQSGYEDVIFTTEGGANAEIFSVGGPAANGLIFTNAYFVPETPEGGTTPLMQDILNRYLDKYGKMPYSDCLYRGYDSMMLIAEAMKNCDNVDSGESIKEAFVALKGIELLCGTYDFTGATGDGIAAANKYMIMDNAIKTYDKAVLEDWRS